MRAGFLILFAAGCKTQIIAIERESCFTCPAGTLFVLPNGIEYTNRTEGIFFRRDIVDKALDVKLRRIK
jgi:hypothetical protein